MPATVKVCVAVAPDCGPTAGLPSPKSKVYLEIPIGSVDPDALAVTASGVAPLLGFNVKAATGAPTATGFVALPVNFQQLKK